MADWATRWPEANVGLGTRGAGLVVLDADDPRLIEHFAQIAGETPLKVRTPSGGAHWYFRDPEGVCGGVNRPGGALYDIKGAGNGDFVLLPGSFSETRGAFYKLDPETGLYLPQAFAALLKDVPPLQAEAYHELARKPLGRTTAVVASVPVSSAPRARPTGACGRVREGERNITLFGHCCREALLIRNEHGDGEQAFGELLRLALGVNGADFNPPLPADEVRRLAASVWRYTLSGRNLPRPIPGRRHPIAEALTHLDGNAKAAVLLARFSALPDVPFEFAAAASAREGVIPGWKRRDYSQAIRVLVDRGFLRELAPAGRGRAKRGLYRVLDPLDGSRPFGRERDAVAALLARGVNADEVVVYLVLAERWGESGTATLSVAAMVSSASGPFGRWSDDRLRKARDGLVRKDLLTPLPAKRMRRDRAPPKKFRIEPPRPAENVGICGGIYTPPAAPRRLTRSREPVRQIASGRIP